MKLKLNEALENKSLDLLLNSFEKKSKDLIKENSMYFSFGEKAENPIKDIFEKYSPQPILDDFKIKLTQSNNPKSNIILDKLA